ncbi:MAG: hypothetical protein LBQ89_07390 [Treponema sp.]|jgi:Na+-transporting methylmalonyl-CoA/oxaloacetate decarboxylase beta subunit|nr:hypothetical protein [Treponema sp.]
MADTKKRIAASIILKIVLVIILAALNYLMPEYINEGPFEENPFLNLNDAAAIAIIGGADGPTTIYFLPELILLNILRYTLLVFLIVNIIILLVYDVIELRKSKKYGMKHKFKIILAVDLFIVLSVIVQAVLYLLGPAFSILLNIVLMSILLIKIYFARARKQEG